MRARRLVLRRETLAALGADDLLGVVGATHVFTDCGCVTHGYSCEACPVPSLPVNSCQCPTSEWVLSCVHCLA